MAGGHVRLPTPPTTRARAAAAPKKARPRCENRSLYCGAFKAPVPCETRRTLERHGLLARDKLSPRAGASVRRSPRGPPETKRASRAPMPRSTLERYEPLAPDDVNPLRDIGVRRSPRGPPETKRASRAPMPRKTLERYEPMAPDDVNPLRDIGVRRSPRGPPETKRASRAPMPCKTLERYEPLALDNINLPKGHKREKVTPRPAWSKVGIASTHATLCC
jgi:hypothetical protein